MPQTDGEQAASKPDEQLIQETKNQIRSLVNEIAQLARSDRSLDDFYDEFLRRVTSALAASGGAIWAVGDQGRLELRYQINFAGSGLAEPDAQRRHSVLLAKAASADGAMLVPPQSGAAGEGEAGNPTDFLLVLAPVMVEETAHAVVEIFQRPGAGPTTQRGYLRFLVQMCDLAADFLKNRRLRQFNDQQHQWSRLEEFVRAIHESLDVAETSFAVANEGKRFVGCDRVSVAIRRGRSCRIEAVSGLDSINRRAAEVSSLARLATAVVTAGEPLWLTDDSSDLPPQIERPLDEYRDRSHAKSLAVLPLRRKQAADGAASTSAKQGEIVGALIFEQLVSDGFDETLAQRAETAARYSATAVGNALEYGNLPLLPLWRALGQLASLFQLRNLPKTVVVAGAIAALVAALVVIPAEMKLAARGKLQPSVRREVFARTDGVVMETPVRHGDLVEPGDVLVRMRNTDLEVQILDVEGRLRTTRERIETVGRMLLDNRRISPDQQYRLDGELLELRQTVESLQRQLDLYRQKQEELVIRADRRGQIVTWRVGESLLRRPVQQGQALMTIVDPDAEWELELNVPERRMGHIAHAAEQDTEGLKVTFMMHTHPDREFAGRVVEMHRTAAVQGDEGAVVKVRVAIDKSQLPELRSETTIAGRIHCGRRSLGYVVFHDLIETVQAKVLFWIS